MARTVPMIAPVHRALLLAAAAVLGGCGATAPIQPEPIVNPISAAFGTDESTVPVVRYGRYGLVELGAEVSQRDLMQQIIDIAMPVSSEATVGDAVRYVLLHSGYQPCASDAEAAPLYALPLPAADLHLGPMTLRDALKTLAGPAWHLQVNETTRQICFTPTTGHPPTTELPAPGADDAVSVPHALPAMETAP
jgi:type IV pili sensor histidine kinase/response regulator